MNLKLMKKVLAFVLAVMMLIPALAGIGSFAAETPTVEIVSKNVWYGETLNLMYAVKVENADGYEIKLDVTKNGVPVSVYDNGEETVKGELCRVFTVEKGVAAQDIDAEYIATVSLVKGEEEIKGNTAKYSVLEYLNERLYISEGVSADQKAMYEALIAHAEAADILLNEDTDGIADLTYVNICAENTSEFVTGIYKKGDVIKLTADVDNSYAWEIVTTETAVLTIEEMATTGYTVGDEAAVITLIEKASDPVELAVFTLGANGSASHYDGSEKSTYTETVNGIKLNISSGSKMYSGARDAKGNACLKFGTTSAVGSMKITVPDNVTEVQICVAKYKSNTTKISVNGKAYTLTKNSNDGAYDVITVDTTVTKTITFTTVSGGVRCMLNTITFIGYAE